MELGTTRRRRNSLYCRAVAYFTGVQLVTLVSPVLTQLRLVMALFKRGSLTARCAAGCEQRSGGKNEERATGRSNASRAGESKETLTKCK